KAPEKNTLDPAEQVIAPIDGCAQSLVPRQSGSAAASQQSESIVQAKRDFFSRNGLHSSRGKLDRQRNAVEPSANLCDGGRIPGSQLKIGNDGSGAIDEEPHGWTLSECVERIQILVRRHREGWHAPRRLASNTQAFTARRQNVQVGTGLQKFVRQHRAS